MAAGMGTGLGAGMVMGMAAGMAAEMALGMGMGMGLGAGMASGMVGSGSWELGWQQGWQLDGTARALIQKPTDTNKSLLSFKAGAQLLLQVIRLFCCQRLLTSIQEVALGRLQVT